MLGRESQAWNERIRNLYGGGDAKIASRLYFLSWPFSLAVLVIVFPTLSMPTELSQDSCLLTSQGRQW